MASQKEKSDFIKELEAFASEQHDLIESACNGFDPDPSARDMRVTRAQNDYRFFRETYFPHHGEAEPSAVHEYIYTVMPGKIDSVDGELEATAAPRSEAKTTVGIQIFILWTICTNRTHYTAIVNGDKEGSAESLEVIKAELESNPRLAYDYPEHVGKGRHWAIGEIITACNKKIITGSVRAAIRGRKYLQYRIDNVYLDDLENDENVKSKKQRDKIEGVIKKAIMKLGPPDGSMNIFYYGTVLHYDSVLNRFMKKPTWNSKRFSAIVRWPDRMDLWDEWEELLKTDGKETAKLFYTQRKQAMDKGAIVTWPAVRPLYLLMTIRAEDHHAFDTEMQNNPGQGDDAPFKDLSYWVHVSRDWVFYGAVDPSLGKRNKSRDPAAILVGGFDRNHGILDIVEAKVARMLPTLIMAKTIEFQKEYTCQAWAFEAVQFQEFLRTQLVALSAQLGIPVPAIPVIPTTDKDLRIESLQPHVFNVLIRSHRNHHTFNEQLTYYPEADHDDGPDALEMLWKLAVSRAGGVKLPKSGNVKTEIPGYG